MAPKWFYQIIAISVAVASAAVAYRNLNPSRDVWTLRAGLGAFNTRTGEYCVANAVEHYCFNVVTGKNFKTVEERRADRELYDSLVRETALDTATSGN